MRTCPTRRGCFVCGRIMPRGSFHVLGGPRSSDRNSSSIPSPTRATTVHRGTANVALERGLAVDVLAESAQFHPDGAMVRRGDRIDDDEAGEFVVGRRPEHGGVDDVKAIGGKDVVGA